MKAYTANPNDHDAVAKALLEKYRDQYGAASDIAEYFVNSEKARGKRYSETFRDPGTKKVIENAVAIPVRLLRALVKEKAHG